MKTYNSFKPLRKKKIFAIRLRCPVAAIGQGRKMKEKLKIMLYKEDFFAPLGQEETEEGTEEPAKEEAEDEEEAE